MDESSSRADRRARSRRRSRAGVAIAAGVAVVILTVVGVLIFAGGDDNSNEDGSALPSDPRTNIELEPGEVTADSAGPPVTVTPEQSAAVIDVIGTYLATATVAPLRSAHGAADLSPVFDTTALVRVNGLDRVAVIDEGLPKVTGNLDVIAKPVTITGLGDQDGNLVLVTATIDLDVVGDTGTKSPLHIVRFGYFVLSPDAAGAWKVTSYSLAVTRAGGGLAAATTTTAAGQ